MVGHSRRFFSAKVLLVLFAVSFIFVCSASLADPTSPPSVCSPENVDALHARLSQVEATLDRMGSASGDAATPSPPEIGLGTEAAMRARFVQERRTLEACLNRLDRGETAPLPDPPPAGPQHQADLNLGTFETASPGRADSGVARSAGSLRVSDCLAVYWIGHRIGRPTLPLANSCLALMTIAKENPAGSVDFKHEACQFISAHLRTLAPHVAPGPDLSALQRLDRRAREWCAT